VLIPKQKRGKVGFSARKTKEINLKLIFIYFSDIVHDSTNNIDLINIIYYI